MLGIDPYTVEFSLKNTDPVTADAQGMAILDKLREGENLRAKHYSTESVPEIDAAQKQLRQQLQVYRNFKAHFNQKPFSHEPQVRERQRHAKGEDFARSIIKLHDGGEEALTKLLDQNGDSEEFNLGQSFMTDKTLLRDAYKERQMLLQGGYTLEQIDSGAADAHLRRRFNAMEDGSETTLAAGSRWSRDKINGLDRRRTLGKAATTAAVKQTMQMKGSFDEFEDALEKDYRLADAERTELRGLYNVTASQMKKSFGGKLPMVRRLFNTYATEEGISSQFTDASFTDMDEALSVMGSIPREDFPQFRDILGAVAEAHGENKDGFWRKLTKHISRAGAKTFTNAANRELTKAARADFKTAQGLKGTGRGGGNDKAFLVEHTYEGIDTPFYRIVQKEFGGVGRPVTDYPKTVESVESADYRLGRGKLLSSKVLQTFEELTRGTQGLENQLRGREYATELSDWRGDVAPINHGGDNDFINMVMDDWVYGIPAALPEMGLAALGLPGLVLVSTAKAEENMSEIRKTTKPEDWEAQEAPAMAAGVVYGLINYAQLKTITKGMPGTQSFLKKATGIWAMETAQELAQDFSLAATLELYGAVDDDIKDFDLLPNGTNVDWIKDGTIIPQTQWKEGEGELMKLIKSAPRMAFAMLPFGVAGAVGSKARDKFGDKPYEDIFQNAELMGLYGISEARQKEMEPLSLVGKLEFVKEHHAEFYRNIKELTLPEGPADLLYSLSADGVYTVTSGGESVTAKSPEEAAKAAEALTTGVSQADLEKELKQMAALDGWETSDTDQEKVSADPQALTDAVNASVDTAVSEHVSQQPVEDQPDVMDSVGTLATDALMGDMEAFKKLPPEVRKAVEDGIDRLDNMAAEPELEVVEPGEEPLILQMSLLPWFNPPVTSIDYELEQKARRKAGLPPLLAGRTTDQRRKDKRNYLMKRTFAGRIIGTKALDEIRENADKELKGIISTFNELSTRLEKDIKKVAKTTPIRFRKAKRAKLEETAYLALEGDKIAMDSLPQVIQESVKLGRANIDFVSKELIKTGYLSKAVADATGNNIGKYITRQYKVHDADYGWDVQTVKRDYPEIYANGVNHLIKKSGITRKEAREQVAEWLDPSKSSFDGFLSGNNAGGKVNVTSYIQRKELDVEIRELLGEIRSPGVNIRNTGAKGAKNLITYKMQEQMAKTLIDLGLASRKVDIGDRFFKENLVGRDTVTVSIVDPKTGEKKNIEKPIVKKNFAGFGRLYVQPEILAELNNFFEGKKEGNVFFDSFLKLTSTAVTVGKFNQVVLSPQAYGTNLLGGLAFEIVAGRISWNNDGAKAYAKIISKDIRRKSKPYTFLEQTKVHAQTVAQHGPTTNMRTEQIEGEMRRLKLLDNSVFAGDLNANVEASLLGKPIEKFVKGASATYQASDNAAKASAFIHEVNKWKKALPAINPKTKEPYTMREVFDLAGRDTRMTTQNYDMVWAAPKFLSKHGLFMGSYISFTSEMIRNTGNNVQLTWEEIFSGNKVLREHGMKRLTGMLLMGTALYALNEIASSVMSSMDEDEREAARAALPPWNKYSRMIWTGPDKDGNQGFFDASYLIPHQFFYNAAAMALRPGTFMDKSSRTLIALTQPLMDLNIATQMVIDLKRGEAKSGKPIWEDSDRASRRIIEGGDYVWQKMFKPGFWRSYDNWNKARTGEVGYAGSVTNPNDTFASMIGVRMRRINTKSDEFINGNLSSFRFSNSDMRKGASKAALKSMTEEKRKEKLEDFEAGEAEMRREFIGKIKMLKGFGVSDDEIHTGVYEAKVPPFLRYETEGILEKLNKK